MSTNPFRRSSLKEASNSASKTAPDPDGTIAVPLSVETRGRNLCLSHLLNLLLTVSLPSSKFDPETCQFRIPSSSPYLAGFIPVLAGIYAELSDPQPNSAWADNSYGL